jgi:hypothetical protein
LLGSSEGRLRREHAARSRPTDAPGSLLAPTSELGGDLSDDGPPAERRVEGDPEESSEDRRNVPPLAEKRSRDRCHREQNCQDEGDPAGGVPTSVGQPAARVGDHGQQLHLPELASEVRRMLISWACEPDLEVAAPPPEAEHVTHAADRGREVRLVIAAVVACHVADAT